MENLFNAKTLKKIAVSILPITFVFVTMFPSTLGNRNYVAADDVGFLVKDPGQSGSYTQVDSSGIQYNGTYKDGNGEDGAHGSVGYSKDGPKQILTLRGISITTPNEFIKIDGSADTTEDNVEIVLEGENIISVENGAPAITLKEISLKFTGDGTLTINSKDGGPTIASESGDADVEFAATGNIKLCGGGDRNPALRTAKLSVTKGNVEVETLEGIKPDAVVASSDLIVNGGNLKVTHKAETNSSGLTFSGDLKVGKNSKLDVTVIKGAGDPIRAAGNATIDGYVRAIGSDNSGYGIEAAGDNKITINHGATVEAFAGRKGALETNGFVIDNSGLWSAAVGESSGQAMALTQIEADALREKLINGQYKYVKMGAEDDASITAGAGEFKEESKDKKDGIPKTGDSTVMILPVLLMVAGAFIVIASNKKTIFDK